ncbi:MAG: SOS response-associated peptidase [Myxococcales bacterium]|jgi:putative SOS response-associated peptidase YedK
MCGRYTLTCPNEETLVRGLPFEELSETRIRFRPRYNIAPGQSSPILYRGEEGPVLADARWGFERAGGSLVINARSEKASQTRMFRDAFVDGRCLVPADGFLEWRKEGQINQPYLFRRPGGGLLLMAGLKEEGRYVILTCDAHGQAAEIHDRMPVLLEPEAARRWLEGAELTPSWDLQRAPVSPRVNQADHDDPGCLEPLRQSSFDFD